MARYRSKDSSDLRWNSIRRRITRQLDLEIAEWREAALDKLLGGAWEQFAAALATGDVVELEAHYEKWVSRALSESLGDPVGPDAAAAA